MSKNIKFDPSQFGTTFEGVRSRKWKALNREKIVVDIGVYIIVHRPQYCFFKFERPVDLSNVYLIIKSSHISRVKTIFLDKILVSPYMPHMGHKKIYAVFDDVNDYVTWKLKNV